MVVTNTASAIAAFLGVPAVGTPIVIPGAGRSVFARLFGALGYRTGAEIGVWEGAFSEELARGIPDLQRLLCVDPWRAYRHYDEPKNNQRRLDVAYAIAQTRLKHLPCELIRMTSTDAAEAARGVPDRSLDFIYIDGNHAEAFVRADLDAWVPKVRSGGVCAGHDYEQKNKKRKQHLWIEVQAAVDRFVVDHQIAPLFVLTGDKSPSWFWVQP